MASAGIGTAALLALALAACTGEAANTAAAHDAAVHADAGHGDAHGADQAPVMDQAALEAAAADESYIVGSREGHGGHGVEYKTPPLESLGGKFELTEVKAGKAFTDKDLLGSWSLIYLGYMECLEACPIALKSLPAAVKDLQAAGVPTRAVFIDINAPRLDDMSGAMGHATHVAATPGAGGHGGHGVTAGSVTGPEVRRKGIAEWSKTHDPSIVMLNGTRKQVADIKRLFMSRVEQTMLPTEEVIHHLNHTTVIYVMNPAGKVVGVLYHSDPSSKMAATVKELAQPGSAPI